MKFGIVSYCRMNKITMIALALVALMAATEAQFGEMGRVSNRFSSRDGIRDFDRSRFVSFPKGN